ncbi:hypothetical protein NTG1052_230014 [Candidatus Nitrotoga sp. 1052]|nr:hypothetical protein NTG1052_230014 [Candidatus Nitrotoga sp. 1052]
MAKSLVPLNHGTIPIVIFAIDYLWVTSIQLSLEISWEGKMRRFKLFQDWQADAVHSNLSTIQATF